MEFRVDLNIFRGPLDLLLYLVRKHEVEIVDIPISLITDQYLEYLEVIEQLDVDAVGDFLAVASMLIEIKSQQVLPRCDEVEEAVEDPREELVRRLLEYKAYRDAASVLDEQSRQWQQRYPRIGSDLPPRQRDLAEEPIREVELWDLVSAFGRIIRAAFSLLGRISFFTVGEDEVKAWVIPHSTKAPKAAGAIHNDFERGFIKAEVMSFEDFMSHGGSQAQVKAAGRLRLEGKEYIVADGDIITFRFNV